MQTAKLKVLVKYHAFFQEINVTGSQKVNDIGIAALLGVEHSDLSGKQTPNTLSQNLRFAKLRSTGVRGIGIRLLFQYAPNVEGIRCSTSDVLQSLAMHLKNANSEGKLN